MKPNKDFKDLGKDFWANIRMISEVSGYTTRATKDNPEGGQVKVPTSEEVKKALEKRGLGHAHIFGENDELTQMGALLFAYFQYRADVLNNSVENLLMEVEDARVNYDRLLKELKPKCPLPLNKQKGDKKAPAYFTGIINMIIEANSNGLPCDFDPRQLTTVTHDNRPLRTFARRIDGAFPSTVNPIAVWEIKEYYYTTTFGSRVADGIYETLLDGLELEELHEHEAIEVMHYLMVDAHYTWWNCGKSYLCRIIDMLHMSYVDEVLFGSEVLEELPGIVTEWTHIAQGRKLEN